MSRGRGRHPHGAARKVPDPQIVEEQARAIQLRTLGLGYGEIAVQMGWSQGKAYKVVAAGLRFYLEQFGAAEESAASMMRLDAATRVAMRIALEGEHKPEIRLAALDRLIRIEARRANLLGLDAPKTLKIRGEIIHVDQLDQAIAALSNQLGDGIRDAPRALTARAVDVAPPGP